MDQLTNILRADVLTPLLMRAAHSSGLLNHLSVGVTMEELTAYGFQESPTVSLLGYLHSQGIVSFDEASNYWKLTDVVRDALADGTADVVRVDQFGTRIELSARSFGKALKSRLPAYEIEYGKHFWDDLSRDRTSLLRFHEQLAELALRLGSECAARLNWRHTERVVDIGGGNGSFGQSLLHVHPHLKYVVFDKTELDEMPKNEIAPGIKLKACRGDMFSDRMPTADTYILCQVLHDWDDEHIHSVIRNMCREEFDRLIVVERDCGLGSSTAIQRMSVRMSLLFGSRERSVSEYAALVTEGTPLILHSSTGLSMGFVAMEFRSHHTSIAS